VLLGVAALLVLGDFDDNLVLFYGPTEFKTEAASRGRQLRATDRNNATVVTCAGGLPDLLGEAMGVVEEAPRESGRWHETRERKVVR
jgi:cytochrome c-type biogenesis protein CcmE